MSRIPKNPLRPLLEEERQQLMHWSRGQALAASSVARAKAVLAVADGSNDTDAARAVGRQSGDAVAAWVARFNVEGLAAVVPRHRGGHPRDYTPVERERILAEARRSPDRERDGNGGVVPGDLATGITPAGVAPSQYVYDLARLSRCGLELAKASVVV